MFAVRDTWSQASSRSEMRAFSSTLHARMVYTNPHEGEIQNAKHSLFKDAHDEYVQVAKKLPINLPHLEPRAGQFSGSLGAHG